MNIHNINVTPHFFIIAKNYGSFKANECVMLQSRNHVWYCFLIK